jgi:hypothetical protein
MASVAAKISKDLAAKKKYPNGTVVKFTWAPGLFGYTFVAIFVEGTGNWYLSGRTPGDKYIMSSEEFLDFLNKCTDIAVATEWEEVGQ